MEQEAPQQPQAEQPYKKPFWWRRDVRVVLGLVLLLIMIVSLKGIFGGAEREAANSSAQITAQFEQLVDGMTVDQVEAIMGKGEVVSETDLAGVSTLILKWEDEFYNSAQATFVDGVLSGKILIN